MAGNRHALTRYRVLDACFSNRMKKYYAEDLGKVARVRPPKARGL